MQETQGKIPLWRQLQATAVVVQAVQNGASGTASLESVDGALRPGVQALAFHVWRNLGRAQALRKQLAAKLPRPDVDALLCTALALAWSDAQAPYDAFTLVNQTVEAAKRNPATRPLGNFVNACLRRFLRERETLVELTNRDPVAVWNHPNWWILRVQRDHPDHWMTLLTEANTPAPMSLRVNTRQSTREDYLALLLEAGIPAHADGPTAICLETGVPVQRLPGFLAGKVTVQDGAAQMAAPLLMQNLDKNSRELRLLDACAAPGGKTGHLLEISNAQVTALDIDPVRCQRISQNLERLNLHATVLAKDAAQAATWWDGTLYDGILLDAPCTASGIVRRHPDVRWLRRESDVSQLAALQKTMLSVLWPLLRSGGYLVYCTCSVFKAEGQEQVQTFLAHNTDAILLPSPGHLMPQSRTKLDTIPDNQSRDHDGFFYALLQKQPR